MRGYSLMREFAKQTRGKYLSPAELREIKAAMPSLSPEILAVMNKIIGE